MLDREPLEREVARIAGREPPTDRNRGGGDQAVGLGQRPPSSGEVPAPFSGFPAFPLAESGKSQTIEEPPGGLELGRSQPAHSLLDVDGAYVRMIARFAQTAQPTNRVPAPTK